MCIRDRAYVTQETHLFRDSIRANLRLAKPDATDAEIEAACKKAAVHDFIDVYKRQACPPCKAEPPVPVPSGGLRPAALPHFPLTKGRRVWYPVLWLAKANQLFEF